MEKTYDLLRQIRGFMAGEKNAQEKLDGLTDLIAEGMEVDVCSIYLIRSGGELELAATHGLNIQAVHVTRLKKGEGLIGATARRAHPLNIKKAFADPRFSYHPETGEDIYLSFLGVPLLRGGRVVGVLAIQSKTERLYNEAETEALQTVAMIVAEVISSLEDTQDFEVHLKKPERFQGYTLSEGLALGQVFLQDPPVSTRHLIADDVKAEEQRLEEALKKLRRSLDAMLAADVALLTGPSRDVLETYRMFAYDRVWAQRLREAVHTGLTAEAAVDRVRAEHRARLMRAQDAYLRTRLHDLEDLANRLVHHIRGSASLTDRLNFPENAIIAARHISPVDLLEMNKQALKGIILEEGEAATSHVAIIAKALNVPAVGGVEGILDHLETGDQVIIDAERGEVHIRPSANIVDIYRERQEEQGRDKLTFEKIKTHPAITMDGTHIHLLLNLGLQVDLPRLEDSGADGVGLFRTEFQFMVSENLPSLKAQTALYKQVLNAAGERPVIFRTLDLGADKVLPYRKHEGREENPALGWRAIRMGLDRPGLLRYQLRALIEAADGRVLRVMFPMVSCVKEFEAARLWLIKELNWARSKGRPVPRDVKIGAMVETPSIAWMIEDLVKKADFISLGTNDLMQYFFAADRNNHHVSRRYDTLHPAFLALLHYIAQTCDQHGVPASVCGEMASRPLEASALIALGFKHLSMPARAIGPVKQTCLRLHKEDTSNFLLPLLKANTPHIRKKMMDFLKEKYHKRA